MTDRKKEKKREKRREGIFKKEVGDSIGFYEEKKKTFLRTRHPTSGT